MHTVFIIIILYRAAKDGTYKSKGWPESAYGTSKVGVTLMSFVQQKEMNKDSREDIVVNAVSKHLISVLVCIVPTSKYHYIMNVARVKYS